MTGQVSVAIGGVVLVAGALATLAAFTSVPPVGPYMFAYWAMIAGLGQLATGLVQMMEEARLEPPAAAATNARLLSGWIGAEDYPAAALRAGVQGRVALAFTVTEQGGVEDAHVLSSSGSGVLDRAALRLIAERFRFDPARDPAGAPIAQKLRRTVTWRLPEE